MANETVLVDWTLFRSLIYPCKSGTYSELKPWEECWNSVIDIIQINLILLKVNINGADFFLIDCNPLTQIFELYKQKIVVPSKLLNYLRLGELLYHIRGYCSCMGENIIIVVACRWYRSMHVCESIFFKHNFEHFILFIWMASLFNVCLHTIVDIRCVTNSSCFKIPWIVLIRCLMKFNQRTDILIYQKYYTTYSDDQC